MTNEEIANLKKSIQEQNLLIKEVLNTNSLYLENLETILNENKNKKTSDKKVLLGDYISFSDKDLYHLYIAKIIRDDNNTYQLYYPLSNECTHYNYYSSIEELVNDFKDSDDFKIISTGKYTNMIPDETSSYVLYKEDDIDGELYEVEMRETNNAIYFYDKYTKNVLFEGYTYDETILGLMRNFDLVIPLR